MRDLHRHLSGKRHVIWDFNGTVLNDVALCVDVIGSILTEHGLPPIDHAQYLERFRFPVIEYYRDLGFDFERTPFAGLSEKFIGRFQARIDEATVYDGVREALHALKTDGIACSMLSATHEADLLMLLDRLEIRGAFEHVYGLGDRLANSKLERGRQLLRALNRPKDELILIGDTDHDLEVAEALGIDALLVTGGHQAEARLSARHHLILRR